MTRPLDPTRPALRIEGLHKSFGRTDVLKGIDLTVAEHEVVGLIGSSGSGKSTLLRCINLLEPIDAGRIFVEGEEITAEGVHLDRLRRR
ncbi:MAG TPA: ATP-binding cassette domain-containing protein, partial [Candidatus Limnocylindrales bacterium]|nr:ATP-binding cassette domain-containing protein [Candidatus Limnocylindrales bacterium]